MTQKKHSQKIKFLVLGGLVKKRDYNTKITKIQGEIPSISRLVTFAAVTAIKSDLENKTPNISDLGKKADYNTKITEIGNKVIDYNHDEYINTPKCNTLTV